MLANKQMKKLFSLPTIESTVHKNLYYKVLLCYTWIMWSTVGVKDNTPNFEGTRNRMNFFQARKNTSLIGEYCRANWRSQETILTGQKRPGKTTSIKNNESLLKLIKDQNDFLSWILEKTLFRPKNTYKRTDAAQDLENKSIWRSNLPNNPPPPARARPAPKNCGPKMGGSIRKRTK